MLPFTLDTYTLFFYLGIFLFVTHIYIYGFGLDLSYFGIILIWIGWAKPVLSDWFVYILWFFLFIDMYFNLQSIQNKVANKAKTKPKPTTKPTNKPQKTNPESTK